MQAYLLLWQQIIYDQYRRTNINMFCRNCGKENLDNSSYCKECGEELHAEIIEQQVQQDSEQQPNYMPDYSEKPVKNYMAFSIITTILTTICCCLPFGIVAVIYSSEVNSRLRMGDIKGAIETSKKAKMWNIISLLLSLLLFIIGIVIFFVGVLSSILSSRIYWLPYLYF